MKINKISVALAAIVTIGLSSCSNDDAVSTVEEMPMAINFSGTYAQEDQMGRPGIATVFPTTAAQENSFNVTIPSQMGAAFQADFEAKLNGLHAAFGVQYENNILGLDAATLTTILASDVLQVATDVPTSYFDGTNLLTGRAMTDDVIDISLILLFGGSTGDKYNGENGTPELVSDNVDASGEIPMTSFPYVQKPNS